MGYILDEFTDMKPCIPDPAPSSASPGSVMRATQTIQPVSGRGSRGHDSSTAVGHDDSGRPTSNSLMSTQQVPTESSRVATSGGLAGQQTRSTPSERHPENWANLGEGNGSKSTLIVAAVAAAGSLLVVALVVFVIVKRCIYPQRRGPVGMENRTIPGRHRKMRVIKLC